MALLSQKELNELLNEVHQSTQHYNIPGDTASVRSIGGLGPAQSVGGSNAAASAGGQVSGFAAMTALLTSIAQDMRTIAQIMTGSGGAGASVGGGASAMVNSMQSRNSPQQGPLATQTTPRVDNAGHVIPPSVDGSPSYMSRVSERASYQGGLQPHALAWDVIGNASQRGRGMIAEGRSMFAEGMELRSQASSPAMEDYGTQLASRGIIAQRWGVFGGAAAGVVGAGLAYGMEVQKAYIARTQPLHDLNVQIARATSAGQYVDDMQRGLLTQAAGMQGNLNAARSWGALIDWVPGVGAAREIGYRSQEMDIASVQGQAERVAATKNIAAWSSPSLRSMVTGYDYRGTIATSGAAVQALKGFGGDIAGEVTSPGETSYLLTMQAYGLTPEEITAPVARASSIAATPAGGALKRYIESQKQGPEALAQSRAFASEASAIRQKIATDKAKYASRGPTNREFRKRQWDEWESQADDLDRRAGAGAQSISQNISAMEAEWAADSGDYQSVMANKASSQGAKDRAQAIYGYQETGIIAGFEAQRSGNVTGRLMAQGAGYSAVNAARSEQARQFSAQAAATRQEADAITNDPMRKRAKIAEAEGYEAQAAQAIQANTFYQNSQESMFFGAAEQTAQIATTRGLYGPGSLGGFQRGIGGQISAAGDTAANLRQQAQRPGIDPGTQASLLAQAAQKELEQSVLLPRQLTTGTMALEDQAMEARRRSAAVTTGKAYYGGDIAGFDIGIAGEIELSKENAKKERRQAQYLGQTDPERALHESAAQEEDIKQIGLYRRSAETHFATSMSYASGLQQQAGAQMTVAQLIGGGKEAYEAATKSVEAFGVQIQAITDRLAAGGLGPEEVAAKTGERAALVTQQHAAELQRGRSYEEAAVSIAGSQAAGAKSIAAGAFARGLGGPAAGGVTAGMMRGAENEYTAAKVLLDKLGQQAQADGIPLSDSVPYQNQLSVVQAKDANRALTSNDIAANTPLSIGSRRAESAGAFNLQVLTSTYTPFGNVRGALAGQMGIYGQQLRELNAMERQQRGTGELTEEGAFAYQQRRQEVGGKLIGAQQQYEQGFMDRIIAATYNAPSSFKGIASQFTMREAAPFMQAMGTSWGFTDANQRDNMMFRYPRLAHSITGMPGSEGFIAAAMGGLGGMYGHTGDGHVTPGGGILKGGGSMGVQTIRVIVEVVEKGTKIGVQDSTHILSNMQNTLNVTLPAVQRPGVHN